MLFFNAVPFGITSENQCEGSVSRNITRGAEAVLECKNSKHQSRTGIVKFQESGDDSKGGHYRASGNTRRADGKNSKKHTEQILEMVMQKNTSVSTEPHR